jgi:predicted ATPase/DNA-binding CsgD family transcriptional regulator
MARQSAGEPSLGLIGRERDLAAIERRLAANRLVTIAGLGGVGKTTLARSVAARHARGGSRAVIVDLAPIAGPLGVGEAIAAAADAAEDPEQTLVESIGEALATPATLLVLDNFEHVLEARTLVRELLAATPTLRVLTTSRVPLGLREEVVAPLGALAVPAAPRDIETAPASALFLKRARDQGRLGRLDPDDAAALVDVCRRLDGLPLALELAARWTGVLSPRAIHRRLVDGRLDLSGDDPRHGSLEAIVRSTLELVDQRAAEAFAVLGVFAGGFDEAAASAVTDDDHVLGVLRTLEGVALIRVTPDPAGEPRFELLETIRAVALASLGDDARRGAWQRHATWYAERAVDAASAVRSSSFSDPVGGAALADPNVLSAFDRSVELGDHQNALRIAAALATRAMQTGILREALARLERALAMTGGPIGSHGLRSDAMNALVSLRGALGRLDGQEDGAREALAEARLADDPIRIVRTLITLGNWMAGDRTPVYAEAADVAEAAGYEWGAATAWNSLADAYWTAGRTDETMSAIVRSQEASERMGDRAGVATSLSVRGEYELNLGRIPEGVAHLDEAVLLFRETPGLPLLTTIALTVQAMGRALDGRPEEGIQILAEAAARVETAEGAEELHSWLEGAAIVLEPRHPIAAARCLGALDRARDEIGTVRVSDRIVEAAAGRVERAIGKPRFARERAAGRDADRMALFRDLARLVRREAGPSAGRVQAPFGPLTAREEQILAQLAEGRTDREIAAALGISAKTASVHVANLKAKLGVETRVEAALFARERLGTARSLGGDGP